jgi:hypothetical protein
MFEVMRGQMAHTKQYIVEMLLLQLKGPLQLSACLRIISYLRRIHIFALERDLQTRFLECRTEYIESLISKLCISTTKSTQAYDYLRQYLDLIKTHLFDVITQYRATFVLTNNDSSGTSLTSESSSTKVSFSKTESVTFDQVLFSWVNARVNHLYDTFSAVLPFVNEGTSLSHVMEQAMYCGYGLARLGVDFRSALCPIFETTILNSFKMHLLVNAQQSFDKNLVIYDWYIDSKKLLKLGIVQSKLDVHTDNLLLFPPLAYLGNTFIAAFNQLRGCAPLSIAKQIIQVTETAVMKCVLKLVALQSDSNRSTSPVGNSNSLGATVLPNNSSSNIVDGSLTHLCKCFHDHFIPLVVRLIVSIYPSEVFQESKVKEALSMIYAASDAPVVEETVSVPTINASVFTSTAITSSAPANASSNDPSSSNNGVSKDLVSGDVQVNANAG